MATNNPRPTQEELLKNWIEQWKAEDAQLGYPNDHKEFTFSKVELENLLKITTAQALALKAAEFAESSSQVYLNTAVLPRVGITPNQQTKILFDLSSGRFMVWIPKPTEDSHSHDEKDSSPEQR